MEPGRPMELTQTDQPMGEESLLEIIYITK